MRLCVGTTEEEKGGGGIVLAHQFVPVGYFNAICGTIFYQVFRINSQYSPLMII